MHRAQLAACLALALTTAAHAGIVTHTIYLHSSTFSTNPDPQGPGLNTITINAGETVQWVWVSGFHSVLQTSGPGLEIPFQSEMTGEQGFVFQHTFVTPGLYNYICEIHGSSPMPDMPEGMWGAVNVIPSPPGAAALLLLSLAANRRRR